jgi:hypothetical protein
MSQYRDRDGNAMTRAEVHALPPFAVTIGPHDILRAKRTEAILYAGQFQRYAFREVLFAEPTMRFPGTLLKKRKLADGSLTDQNLTVWATSVEAGPVTSQTIG